MKLTQKYEFYVKARAVTWLVRIFINKLFKNTAIQEIIVDVDPANHRAVRCYEKTGFKLVEKIQTPDGLVLLMEIKR